MHWGIYITRLVVFFFPRLFHQFRQFIRLVAGGDLVRGLSKGLSTPTDERRRGRTSGGARNNNGAKTCVITPAVVQNFQNQDMVDLAGRFLSKLHGVGDAWGCRF